MPPNPSAPSSASSRIRTPRPDRAATAAACPASQAGVLTSDGVLTRSRASDTAAAITSARGARGPAPGQQPAGARLFLFMILEILMAPETKREPVPAEPDTLHERFGVGAGG